VIEIACRNYPSLRNFTMEAPGGVEPPTNGLGNRCSIQLSYGATATQPQDNNQFTILVSDSESRFAVLKLSSKPTSSLSARSCIERRTSSDTGLA
jgi:hypothetical protein